MTESDMFYVAVCRECGDDLEMPFTSARDRGKWCAAHRDGVGHDQWLIFDIPRGDTDA